MGIGVSTEMLDVTQAVSLRADEPTQANSLRYVRGLHYRLPGIAGEGELSSGPRIRRCVEIVYWTLAFREA